MKHISLAYYNENDPLAVAWLRELIKQGHIAYGDVDERSIEDVCPEELRPYTQVHLFAGIGGWSYALRLAGWPDDRPVWTGSCPCQPFSAAGKVKGTADERHLWPAFHWILRHCQPAIVFGEQVAGRAGEAWLDLVQADLALERYTCRAAVIAACGFGAPHQRKRIYWVANASGQRRQQDTGSALENETTHGRSGRDGGKPDRHNLSAGHGENGQVGPVNSFWQKADWLLCQDGKRRPVEPGTFPLANGVSDRVGRLRGYGNAIVPQVAAQFIRSSGV